MADKAFIDSVVRLKTLYQEAAKDPFPIRSDAYKTVTRDQLADGQVVYGLSAYCNFDDLGDQGYKPVRRLH